MALCFCFFFAVLLIYEVTSLWLMAAGAPFTPSPNARKDGMGWVWRTVSNVLMNHDRPQYRQQNKELERTRGLENSRQAERRGDAATASRSASVDSARVDEERVDDRKYKYAFGVQPPGERVSLRSKGQHSTIPASIRNIRH